MRIAKRTLVCSVLAIGVSVLLIGCVGLNLMAPEKRLERRLLPLYKVGDPQFMREMGTLLGPAIVSGNRVEALQNGNEIFPSMLAAIRAAQRSITFETYIYWSGEIGQAFADALSERAQAGVRVHVMLDWVGSIKMEEALIESMKDAGVEVHRYHPLHWYHLARLNNRTHRKVLVVDGKVGFTGGVGIADVWTGHAQDPEHWRDAHFRFEGPVVAQAQAVFIDNWIKATGTVLQGEDYFPPLAPAGEAQAQMFSSSPTGGSESMMLMYLMAISSARRSIDLAASYFVPDELSRKALTAALRRGVELRIVVPGEHIDADTVRHASRSQWGPLLEAGASIYEFAPTMYHCKIMVVDEYLVSVGSTNFDNRSFSLNDEASLNIYDQDFARRMVEVIEGDIARSRRVSLEAWRGRPLGEKLRELVILPLKSQL